MDDCVGFATSIDECTEWAKRNHVHWIEALPLQSRFATIEIADCCGTPVKVAMTIDQMGLQSFSLRRIDWLKIGNSIPDYDAKALRAEYRNLSSLVEQAVKRKPDKVTNRASTWIEVTYEITVSYELTAFEVGIFYSRRKD